VFEFVFVFVFVLVGVLVLGLVLVFGLVSCRTDVGRRIRTVGSSGGRLLCWLRPLLEHR
jgi:ribose/xylose/arabinose/galactoside ABC-type transport system permease subunit